MNFGYVRVATFTPEIKVADVDFNVERIIEAIEKADQKQIELLTFPELCVTGYTCGDLFYSSVLLDGAKRGVIKVAKATLNKKMLVFIGMPIKVDGLIYNCAVAISNGKILGIVPKTYLPNYNEFYEKRCFSPAYEEPITVKFDGLGEIEDAEVLFYKNIIFCDDKNESFKVSAEICEDLWTPTPPSIYHTINGARIVVNLSASDENTGKASYRRNLVANHSSKTVSVYCYANAGYGESTTDTVFSGHSMIAENGELLCETKPFENGFTVADVDLDNIDYERSKSFNHGFKVEHAKYVKIGFSGNREITQLDREYSKTPFIGNENEEELILTMQAEALRKRIDHTGAKRVVLGLSGGLDSTLAAIVCAKALERMGRPKKDLLTLTMPCFGTTSRTFDNSVKLAKALGADLKKVDISKSVLRHLKDIDHDATTLDAAYENSQARERTQVLMDVANMENGLVVGTGDLSELALGWATYNGDHMSMYAVNGSIPKTLVRHLVEFYRDNGKGKIKAVLSDILDTPVSPELLPAKDGEIQQKTEDIVGPYLLHDFFLYNIIKRGFSPKKLYFVACKTFDGQFDKQTVLKWLKNFFRRFFNQQFKRSCMPDGVKIGAVTLSPRGSWRMPSDAQCVLWQKELENLS